MMQDNMGPGRSRVFINPNFHKGANEFDSKNQVTVMHVNPNFYQHMQNMQLMSKGKIYINPKFVGSNRISNKVPFVNRHNELKRPGPLVDGSNIFRTEASSKLNKESTCCTSVSTKSSIQPIQSNTRYSLVRHKGTELVQTVTNAATPETRTKTVKINKYKTIRITDMKKNIDYVKPVVKSIPSIADSRSSTIQTMINNNKDSNCKAPKINRYKFVRSQSVLNKTYSQKQIPMHTRKVLSSRIRLRTVGVYKKNNIPCPQYRKYGKCLRKLQGKCEFLHDKKHVSICRKFLTGACHDAKCLLSHELSDKKMPTCYFYLKGMCTKEGCPYLHVKLNEKAKICPDFIRGYCEKGDTCLNRHITKSSSIALKRRQSLRKLTPQKSMKYAVENVKVMYNIENAQKRKRKIAKLPKQASLQDTKDSRDRYYKDSIQEPSCSGCLEVIKPSRCKLGTLPSFIQL